MKSAPSQLFYFLRNRPARRNVFSCVRFLLILAGLVTLYGILFHYSMAWEGRASSWITGFYWTLTVMSTLGRGNGKEEWLINPGLSNERREVSSRRLSRSAEIIQPRLRK